MHSKEIVEEANKILNDIELGDRDKLVVRALVLNAIATNEVNWSLTYIKEQLKNISADLQRIGRML